jgi:hypothetical protein
MATERDLTPVRSHRPIGRRPDTAHHELTASDAVVLHTPSYQVTDLHRLLARWLAARPFAKRGRCMATGRLTRRSSGRGTQRRAAELSRSAALLHICGIFAAFEAKLRESLEMRWPAFNELGDLPIGVYRAMLAEVIVHFGHGTAQRVAITARLEHIYALARRTGAVQRFIIFGNSITPT